MLPTSFIDLNVLSNVLSDPFDKQNYNLKPSQNKKGQKCFLAATKMLFFSQLPVVKKDTIFDTARQFFGPSLFL